MYQSGWLPTEAMTKPSSVSFPTGTTSATGNARSHRLNGNATIYQTVLHNPSLTRF